MNLYGDWANAAVIERDLKACGHDAVIDKKSVGNDIDFDTYDFIYIGSGTERSQLACMRDMKRFNGKLNEKIEAGVPVLSTGNSHELFGHAVTDLTGKRYEMLGLLDFETVQLDSRVTGDCLCSTSFIEDKLVGFINRAGGSQKGDIERPFSVEPVEGANYAACSEGIKYNNLIGTYLTGPVLVRNPPLLKYFTKLIIKQETTKENVIDSLSGKTINDKFFDYQEKAYKAALSKL